MKRILFLAVLLVVTATAALAIPAKRMWRTVTQPDGTQLKLMLVGDERLSYFVTEDGVPVLQSNNAYYYADGIGFGMKRSNVLAHAENLRKGNEIQLAKTASVNRIEQMRPSMNQNLFRHVRRVESNNQYTSDRRDITGKHKSIVILAEFPNQKFLSNHDRQYYDDMVNKEGYTNSQGAIGSIHDYFKEQSAGKLDLTFDVVGPVEMDYDYSHYGGNQYFQNGDNGWEFAYEAITKAHDQHPDLNWAAYDWDGDGEVENLYIIYAGFGEATGGSSSTIWPAQTSFDDYNRYYGGYGYPMYNINYNGIKINTFAYGNELYGSYGTTPQGMGTMTHEFSHCLGFPDLYDVSYGGNYGMNIWSVMDQGSYGGPNGIGWVPTGYTAYEKWCAGWIDYKEFKYMNDTISNLKSTRDGGDAYVIYNDKLRLTDDPDAAEYFLFENRAKSGFDTYLPEQGLEVMHVNYVRSIWDENSVNNALNSNRHQNVTIVPADNSTSRLNTNTDLFPYNNRDSITPNTAPNLTFYNGQSDGSTVYSRGIYDIKYNNADQTVSFIYNKVDTNYTPAPTVYSSNITATASNNNIRYYKGSAIVTLEAYLGNIRYSFDKENWTDYTEPFTISSDDSMTLYAYAWRPGKENSDTTSVLFIKQKKLDVPVISGDTIFTGRTQVTITGEGGRIYYAQGANTTHFRSYSRPINISSSTVVKAYVRATSNAYLNSDTVSVRFTKLEATNPPVIAVSDDTTAITIMTDVNDGHIWYNTTARTADYDEYTSPIDITGVTDSITVWAYVTADGHVTSDTVSYTYVAPNKGTTAIRAISINGLDDLNGRVTVYSVGGQRVATADRLESIVLRPGLYIVRDENGKTKKVTVK